MSDYEPQDPEAWARKHGLTEEELVEMQNSLGRSATDLQACKDIVDELFPEDARKVRGTPANVGDMTGQSKARGPRPGPRREVEDHGRNPT